jgi:hypothetical protein
MNRSRPSVGSRESLSTRASSTGSRLIGDEALDQALVRTSDGAFAGGSDGRIALWAHRTDKHCSLGSLAQAPSAPTMTREEFEQAQRIYLGRYAGCHGALMVTHAEFQRWICPKWTVGKIPTGEADSPQSGAFRRGQPPVIAIFKYVISRQNGFPNLPWHRACFSSPRGNWRIHPNHDLKAASMREAEWESAVETVRRAMQGPIQVPIAEANHSPSHAPDKCHASGDASQRSAGSWSHGNSGKRCGASTRSRFRE